MNLVRKSLVFLAFLCAPAAGVPSPDGSVSGKVTFTGTPPKARPVDMSKQPECIKMHAEGLKTEDVVTGAGGTLENVVVYVSAGPPDPSAVPGTAVGFDQQGCHYATHVLAFRVGQDVKISNSDPFTHNIHPLAKINREWNRIQLPGTPAFSYSYENEEFIPIKCNIHAWMKAYFVVLRTSHFAVTGEDGRFSLLSLAPGRYTVTAWHEIFGTQSREITIGLGEARTIDFAFNGKP
jgi:plastocyanin